MRQDHKSRHHDSLNGSKNNKESNYNTCGRKRRYSRTRDSGIPGSSVIKRARKPEKVNKVVRKLLQEKKHLS